MRISDWSSDVCSSDLSRAGLLDQLSLSIQIRRIRRSHFGTAEISGPVWDMMLDLMLAGANGRVLSASDLATGAGVPLSSGLRMIASLEQRGLVHRSIDERDRLRTTARLSDGGTERKAGLFAQVRKTVTEGRSVSGSTEVG